MRGISSEGINKVPYSKTFSLSRCSTCMYKQIKLGAYFPKYPAGDPHTIQSHTHKKWQAICALLHHVFYVDILKCQTQTTLNSGTVLFLFWWNLHSEKTPVHLELFIRESSTSHCCPTNFVQQITGLLLFTVSISNQKGRDFTVT